ncbi:hypothetical protein MI170_11885 [Mycolicibacterium goodii]|uniref:hypothetical protein n=1 Tax=Mycolicibacterium goodii TaxID=134601 RepID=UPI001F04C9D5|nr:hypothetical protein [Mycolicibacterium goodii]ULN49969.1 hypothetical protein MI170_11885 [Mycolicibacterium goodii]
MSVLRKPRARIDQIDVRILRTISGALATLFIARATDTRLSPRNASAACDVHTF